MIGQTISHYRITEKLGEGGMGVVYKAEDTKLERAVALKFLPPHLLGNEEVRKRFEREAKAAAALHHPNICPVYEIDEVEGKAFIAMAFIEGESLDKKIAQGPLKLDDALDIAQQIATGLEAAHEKGIFHRDVKPENVIVNAKGHVTIMDFGLAQLAAEASRLTRDDTTLGTVAYMSPEQTEGSGTDQRTDIWSLGVVLYEMVTGQQPFKGDYEKAVMYSILNEEPEPMTALRTGVPMELEGFVGKCLAKAPEDRYSTSADLATDLRILAKKLTSGRSAVIKPEILRSPAAVLPWALFFVASIVAASLALLHFTQPSSELVVRRFAFKPPAPLGTLRMGKRQVAISPNGRHIAFTAPDLGGILWVQDLDREQPRALDGTEGANGPFWSPTSDRIGFFVGSQVKTIPVAGGPAISVCRMPSGQGSGGTWSPDGESIVFSSGAQLYEVLERGGAPKALLSSEDIEASGGVLSGNMYAPHFLPSKAGPKVLVFSVGTFAEHHMVLYNFETGLPERLGPGVKPFYSSSGHIVYQADMLIEDLWALPFSLDKLRPTGEPFLLRENRRDPTIARDETLVSLESFRTNRRLVRWTRAGEELEQIGPTQEAISHLSLSPDGERIAVVTTAGENRDIWVWDIQQESRVRLTSAAGPDSRPVWSPSGDEVVFSSLQAGNVDIILRRADGSGQPKVLAATPQYEAVCDWSSDGNYILYEVSDPKTAFDIWFLQRDEASDTWEPRRFLQSTANERVATLSPDGRFVAYISNESGRDEIYVQPFPDGGRKWAVSRSGGWKPRWSRDGTEIFYVEGQTLVSVSVSSDTDFSVDATRRLFEHSTLGDGGPYPWYEAALDGRSFLLSDPEDDNDGPSDASIHITQNWYAEFRDRE